MTERPSEEDFDNAVFVLAEEREEDGGVTVTLTDFQLCAPEPLRLVVLMHWRLREQNGQQRNTEAIWSMLSEMGVYGSDGDSPVRLDEVRQAVDFLISEGLVTSVSGGEL